MGKIAFLVIAHSDVSQLSRLSERLFPHDLFIHWDRNSGKKPGLKHGTFIPDPVGVYWGGFSQIVATTKLIRMALSQNQQYERLVLLSGACYPIKPIAKLQQLFAQDDGQNYINAVDMLMGDHLLHLTTRYYWRDGLLPSPMTRQKPGKILEKALRHLLETTDNAVRKRPRPPFPLYHGSQWWALTPEAAKYALDIYDNDGTVVKYFRHSLASDEQFFQTVVRNSSHSSHCAEAIPYAGRGTYRTANLHVIDASLAKWFDINDLPQLVNSEKFFVRKVSTEKSTTLLDSLDRML